MDERRRKRRKWIVRGTLLALAAAVGYFGFLWIPVLKDFWDRGILQDYLSPPKKREYHGTNVSNLKAMHTALMMYHDSEGRFPDASAWMDAIERQIRSYDMKDEEAAKKLVHPMFLPPKPGVHGYALNDACSGKYIDDIPDKAIPLVFDSKDTSKNAHGKPEELLPSPPREGGNLGMSVEGKLLKF